MNEIINKEPVQRVIKLLNKFDKNLQVRVLKETARTAKDAANALNCEAYRKISNASLDAKKR